MQTIYFARAGRRGPIKIGYTTDVRKRLASLSTGSAKPLELIGEAPGGPELDKLIHGKLRTERLNGEWFKPSRLTLDVVEQALTDIAGLSRFADIPVPRRPAKPRPRTKKEKTVRANANPNIDRDAPASRIATKFGSMSKLSQALKKTPSTVHRWLISGHIPPRYHDEVIAAAKERKITLKPADFVDQRAFAKPQAPAEAKS